ncbi:MAG: hypothetical protein WC310_05190 [Patescibacteria group bacterium]|jgi:hypothetical protein
MGGGGDHYERDVDMNARRRQVEQHFEQVTKPKPPEERKVAATLDPKKIEKLVSDDSEEYPETTSIAVIMDLTRSRGKDLIDILTKMPLLMGQVMLEGYVRNPAISFCGVGDATDGDAAPLQVGQFETDDLIDRVLQAMWPEGGGGGSGQESYQLAAYMYAIKAELASLKKRNQKGYLFIIGDEGFYPKVSKDEVKRVIGASIPKDIPSAEIFRLLQEKFNVFFIYPAKSWEERKEDIDEEIAARVRKAGGMIEGVDIRFSLAWSNRNDLDLHVIDPDGFEIYYGSKVSRSGGMLDVDMNVHGETTKPVENTRWAKGKAPKGTYRVFVRNYGFHENTRAATPFRVEIEIGGEVEHFEGKTPANSSGAGSDVEVGTFTFDPQKVRAKDGDEKYAGYRDNVVLTQWGSVIPQENILRLKNPKAIVDAMLGVLAICSGSRTLPAYLQDMKNRGQTVTRIKEIETSLDGLAQVANTPKVTIRSTGGGKTRKSGATRI